MDRYFIGVDGGGTKTNAVISKEDGLVIARAITGPSNIRNVGSKASVENVGLAISEVCKKAKGEVVSVFIGLASVEEGFGKGDDLKRELLRRKGIGLVKKAKIFFTNDQDIAFRAGTEEMSGTLVISGTGSVAKSKRNSVEFKVGGWGCLNDEGSGFWIGQEVFRSCLKVLDGRDERKSSLPQSIFSFLEVSSLEEMVLKVYKNDTAKAVSQFSLICDLSAEEGDLVAIEILKKAASELALGAITCSKKLWETSEEFPIVCSGGVFKSEKLFSFFQEEVLSVFPKARIIRPADDPVIGALKLAIEKA